MIFIKRFGREILIGISIIFLYFFTRLYNIMSLPIFTDEAIYTRWSQIAKNDANWRFISLTDGKQPMFVWLDMTLMRVISDPLLSGRLVSVLAGFITMIGLFFLGKEIFKNWKVGLVASFLYAVYPFALVYDRMALYESLVSMFMVWALYLEVLLVRTLRLDVALILGMVMGGGVLTKSNTLFAIALLPFSLFLFDFRYQEWKKKLILWIFYAGISSIIALGFYSILRLSPFFHIIKEKNATFAYPFNEWIQHPFFYFVSNLRGMSDWLVTYFTWPLFLLVFFSFLFPRTDYWKQFLGSIKLIFPAIGVSVVVIGITYVLGAQRKLPEILPFLVFLVLATTILVAFLRTRFEWSEKVLLVLWFIIPFVYLALFGKTIYPRFILFMTLPLLVLVSYSLIKIVEMARGFIFFPVMILFVILPLRADYYIITDIARAPVPRVDLDQYINTWPSGGGIREVVVILEEEAKKGKIFVATQGTFGLMPYSLEIYLGSNPNIKIQGFWPIDHTLPKEITEAAKTMPVYVVFYQPCHTCRTRGEAPAAWPVTLIAKYKKGIGPWYLRLYRVNSD